jgi:hypothetical protein
MNIFATVIVANKNKAAAQNLLTEEFFNCKLKKGIRIYWISSGPFLASEYQALVDSDLAYHIATENEPKSIIDSLGLTIVPVED